jgi:hypothetical protein
MAVSSQATTEQLQMAQRLLEILSPYGVQTRTDMIERGGRFVHYTSAENGLKIINTKTIWMRNTNCMTDYSEVQHGFNLLNKFFADASKAGEFKSALDGCVDGVGKQAFDRESMASSYAHSICMIPAGSSTASQRSPRVRITG